MAWLNLIRGFRLRSARTIDRTTLDLPADMLVDEEGRIIDCLYGRVDDAAELSPVTARMRPWWQRRAGSNFRF